MIKTAAAERLEDHGLAEAGQLQHVVDDGAVERRIAQLWSRVDRRGVREPPVFGDLEEGEPSLRLDDEHVANEVLAV